MRYTPKVGCPDKSVLAANIQMCNLDVAATDTIPNYPRKEAMAEPSL